MPVPQTLQRRSFRAENGCSSFGCWGSTAQRNQRQSRLREMYCRQTCVQQQAVAIKKLQQRFVRPLTA